MGRFNSFRKKTSLYYYSLNIYYSWKFFETSNYIEKVNYKKIIKRFKTIVLRGYGKSFNQNKSLKPYLSFIVFSGFLKRSKVSLFKLDLFYLYMKNFNLEIFTRILLFFKLYLYWFINSRFQNSINYNLNISKSRTSFNVKKLSVYKKFEGISLKRFIILALSKISNLKKIKINFIQLNRPNKKAYAFFNTLKRNVKARGPFKKEVFKIFIILYQSVLFKSPKMFGFYMMSLIKKKY